MWRYPCIYDKFYALIDDMILRCSRLPVGPELDPTKNMKIRLLDTGEDFVVSINNLNLCNALFEMPESIKDVPPAAINCCVNEIEVENANSYESYGDFLEQNLYNKFTFEVISKNDEKLMVDILPFDEVSSSIDSDPIDVVSNCSAVEETEKEIKVELCPSIAQHPLNTESITKNYFTKEELEVWEEEPLNTGNALIAVQGFQTRDDHKICKFYDPTIGGCWKGGLCRMIHMTEITDGTCRDRQNSFFDIPNSFPVPQLHSTVTIEITSFIEGTRFYCRYPTLKERKNSPGVNLESLMIEMNSEVEMKRYERLQHYPNFKQLVLVKSSDEKIYRARVENMPDEKYNVDLLLVDLGIVETAPIKMLYNWVPRFNYLEFQTVEMEIADIQLLPDGHYCDIWDRVVDIMEKSLKNTLRAFIVENIIGIKCKLFDRDDNDIGDLLVDEGLALARKADPPTIQAYRIPV